MSAEKAVQRVLVLDLGSSSVRCTAFNLQCEAVQGSEVKENCAITDGVGDGERYYSAATSALKRCVEFLRGHDHKFCFSTLVMNLIGVDSNGHSVTPLYTYATRVSANAMQQLRDKVAEKADEVYRTSYAPALFTHLSLESKGHDTRVARWHTIASLVISRWCRCEAPVSTSEASWMGLYDRTEDKWCEALMALFPEQVKRLPRLAHWGAETFRVVDPELPHETRDAAVHLGLPDGVAANLGCGSWDQSSACVTIGTSAALRTVVHGSIHSIPPGLWLYTIDEKRSLLGGALTDGGNIFAYLKDLLKFGSASEATDAAASAPACADGVLVMPFLGPERAPGWRARHLTITGVTHSTKPGTIMRAGLEGVAFRLALIYRLMKPQLSHTNFRLIAAGHSLEASQVWRQIVADTLDAQLALPSVSETTSRGVAVMIAQRIAPHSIPTLQENLMDPNKQHVEAYRAALTRHETLYTGIYGSS